LRKVSIDQWAATSLPSNAASAAATGDGLMNPRRHLWLSAVVCLVAVGTCGSVLGAHVVARNDAEDSHQLLLNSSAEIASTLKLAIQHEQDLVVAAGAFFVHSPNSTQAAFRQWMTENRTFQQYPELTGIAEVEIVTASRLKAFEASAIADPAGTLAAGGRFQIVPAGARPYYCFASVSQSRTKHSVEPAGLDYCDTILGPEFLKARDSGQGAYLPYGSGKSEELVIGTPIYSDAVVPGTVQARRAAFIGWTGTLIVPEVLLSTAVANHPETAVAFQYRSGSSRVTFKDGAAPSGAQSATVELHNGWNVQTYSAINGGGMLTNANALALLLSGFILSLLLGALIYVLGTSRSRALAMVNERTDQLQHQALHDSLTGLPNRALILDRIHQMLARARRDHTPVALLFLDLDNFKDINDTLGHTVGDQLLAGVGIRLASALREGDTVGRLGGDEFVILAEGASLAPGAEAVAQRVLDVLGTPFNLPGNDVPLNVSASIGIAEGLRAEPEQLLRDADIAMYRAKSIGKQCAVVFLPSMQTAVDDHRSLGVDLRIALEESQFFLLYQPTIDLTTGALTGVEALLRWRHPQRGVIQPDEFIPALESNGLIVPVGLWVLREACRRGVAWHSQGHRFSVSVNISAKQLERGQFVDDVKGTLSASGFDPTLLILELTETTLMLNVKDTVVQLTLLKQLGVRLAIDDFGTGYSSLAYLQQFPIDILKIDRCFVSGVADSTEAAALVHALVQLGKALGLEIIAEGIENKDQCQRLIAEEVNTGQGFFFARPLDVESVDRLLRARGDKPAAWLAETHLPSPM
jgi:diguanylate cyclase (GGDEF)-like protein